MSHLIEEYAKSLGVKIGKPVLNDHYYPLLHDKYITIHTDNKINSKNYEYFPQVINLIKPILLKNGYKIFQIGGPNDPKLESVDEHFLTLTYRQSAFILKNSKLHLGIDSLPVHIASMYDIPIVALYSHIMASNASPYWSSPEKIILLESDKKQNKPSYAYEENPKSIRTIKPEQIAKSIFNLLKIDVELNFNTLKIGEFFHIKLLEVIPDFKAKLENQDQPIYLRADLHMNYDNIFFWCQNYKCNLITKDILPIDLIAKCRHNIESIFFKIDGEELNLEYLDQLKKIFPKFKLCLKDKNKLGYLRNKYFDFTIEYDNINERLEKAEKINGKFLTNKILISNGKLYASEAHFKIQKTLDSTNEVIYDDNDFWKDLEHYFIYEQN